MTIGRRIAELRGKESRRIFSKRIGIAENTLRNYEENLSLPNSDVIAIICNELGVMSDWLLFGTGPMRAGESALAPANTEYERRIAELEKALAEAKDEALKAYKLAVEAMRAPTNAIQEPEEPTTPKGDPVFHHELSNFRQRRK